MIRISLIAALALCVPSSASLFVLPLEEPLGRAEVTSLACWGVTPPLVVPLPK